MSNRKSPKRKSRRHSPNNRKSRRKSPNNRKSRRKSPKKSKASSEFLKKLSAKYNLQTYASGRPIPPRRLAERLNLYVGSKLTKTEKRKILPYLNKKSPRKQRL